MIGRDRVLATLAHQEPDHVPLDIGGSDVTGIHRDAYRSLARFLGLPEDVPLYHRIQQLALPSEEMLQRLQVDVRPLVAQPSDSWELVVKDTGTHHAFTDEWGVEWAMPKAGGLYFDMVVHPLGEVSGAAELADWKWPDGANKARFQGLRHQAELLAASGLAITLAPAYGGILESAAWLRGYENFYMDLIRNPALMEAILDATLRFHLDFWAAALEEVGDLLDVAVEYDDLGWQSGLLMSKEMYRRYVKPRHKELFSFIKAHSRAAVFLHSCGAVYDLIPDFIESGVDILNPVQVSAARMDNTRRLKDEFGDRLVFWGGGVDTQAVLPRGTPAEVKKEVKRRIGDLAPGGGFVFAAVHNIQPDVPPENIMALWEAWQEYGSYR
ncbi:MAG TPA: uroporphyrinogen decarboxylase family protein [Anaerolineae bacterium]|nr:uroporphyrinogen decarboxylase family protein [Anaerolineae bacterium]